MVGHHGCGGGFIGISTKMTTKSVITIVVLAGLFSGFLIIIAIYGAMIEHLKSKGICITPQIHSPAIIEKCV